MPMSIPMTKTGPDRNGPHRADEKRFEFASARRIIFGRRTFSEVAALMTNQDDMLSYLEVIGRGQPLGNPPVPFIAVPTTAGTGAEVTANAVLKSPEHGRKVSLRGPFLLPAAVVVDPVLSAAMPPALTIATGMDALTQLIEAFLSRKANPLTDAFCREGLSRVGRSLRRAWRDGNDLDAREDMSLAALLSGMALANAGLGAVHGFAAVIGGMTAIPHGVVCARLLFPVLKINLEAMGRTEQGETMMGRLQEMGRLLTGKAGAGAAEGVEWVGALCGEAALPRLASGGLHPQDFPTVVAMAGMSSSMRGNRVDLSEKELLEILQMEQRLNERDAG